MSLPLLAIAKRHCLASKPALCVKAFVRDHYGYSYDALRDVQCGRVRPSQKLLISIAAMHVRLFPSEPLPNGLPRPQNNPSLN